MTRLSAVNARYRRLVAALCAVAACVLGVVAIAPTGAAAATGHGWQWTKHFHVKHLDPSSSGGISCPSAHLCVAASSTTVLWSTHPTSGAKSWHSAVLEPTSSPYVYGTISLYGLSCPTTRFCAAVDDIGNVFTTTDPTGGKAAWHGVNIDDTELTAVDCSGPSLCAALDYEGRAFTSTAPASGLWRGALIGHDAGADFYSVSCAGSSLCVGVEANGRIYRTTNPGATAPNWHHTKVKGSWNSVDCPSTHKCVAVGDSGRLAVSTSPAKGAWQTTTFKKAPQGFSLVSCHGASFCFAVGDYWSSNPRAHTASWHATSYPASASQTEIACPTAKTCIIGDISGDLRVGSR